MSLFVILRVGYFRVFTKTWIITCIIIIEIGLYTIHHRIESWTIQSLILPCSLVSSTLVASHRLLLHMKLSKDFDFQLDRSSANLSASPTHAKYLETNTTVAQKDIFCVFKSNSGNNVKSQKVKSIIALGPKGIAQT